MTRIFLVRHATTAETGKRLSGRTPGIPLDDAGRTQAHTLTRQFSNVAIEAIYTSPIERTAETAAILAEPRHLSPISESGVTEIDFGTWSGRTFPQLRRTRLWESAQSQPSLVRFPSGESFTDAQHRAVSACQEIAARHRRGQVIVVSHADVIKLILAYYLGMPLDVFQRLAVDPASISILALPSGSPARLLGLNLSKPPS